MAVFDEALIFENLAKDACFSGEAVNEIKQQIFLLEQNIAKFTAELKILSSEVKILEKELSAFMEGYCKEIVPLFRELNKMETLLGGRKDGQEFNDRHGQNQLSGCENFTEFAQGDSGGENSRKKEKANELYGKALNWEILSSDWGDIDEVEIKKIYKKLAKIYHPDLSPSDPNANNYFTTINDLYAKKDFASLILMDQIASDDASNSNEIVRLESLEKRCDSVLNATDKLRLKKHEITNSPAYELMQNSRWQKMCGNDVISVIKKNLIRSIKIRKIALGVCESV